MMGTHWITMDAHNVAKLSFVGMESNKPERLVMMEMILMMIVVTMLVTMSVEMAFLRLTRNVTMEIS